MSSQSDDDSVWQLVSAKESKLPGVHYTFLDANESASSRHDVETLQIPLLRLVQLLVGSRTGAKTVSQHALKLNIGRLRSAQLIVGRYNANPGCSVARFRAAELLSSMGIASAAAAAAAKEPTQPARIHIAGLDSLLNSIDPVDGGLGDRHDPQAAYVSFDDLDACFAPGRLVTYPTSVGHASERTAARVYSCHFEERRSAFGSIECQFNLELETVVPLGSRLGLVTFTETFSGWTGERRKRISELLVRPLLPGRDDEELESFELRGRRCLSLLPGANEAERYRFLAYEAGGFFAHADRTTSTASTAAVPSGAGSGGRIVVDGDMALALGHHPSQGSTEADHALLSAAGRYKRSGDKAEGLLVLDAMPDSLIRLVWPALSGFSLTAKRWGHVLVSSLSEIRFNRAAFDQLVLSPERKRLIHAVVNAHRQEQPGQAKRTARFRDIIASKSGGTVFLLHGAPGVGKTLTAEAVAEMLGRPVYYVTMGELGTAVENVEARLAQVLDLCAAWQAVVLIDEADVFLERRASGGGGDILRNALVCVVLRLIEYFSGILFLTTNRVASFDPALESRVTIALRYDALDAGAREQVWRNLLGNLEDSDVDLGQLDFGRLAKHELNGRQIKNTIRLALALAVDAQSPLDQALLDLTLQTTMMGRLEMEGGYSM